MLASQGWHRAQHSETQIGARWWRSLVAVAVSVYVTGAVFADEYEPTPEWMQTISGHPPKGPYATPLLACQGGNSARQDIALVNRPGFRGGSNS